MVPRRAASVVSRDRSGEAAGKMHGVRTVVVNHNTSRYTEVALRSLLALNRDLAFDLTVLDNGSTDETAPLFEWARRHGVQVQQSGFTTSEPANTHGEVLGAFVLASPPGAFFLFLDPDICFLHAHTIALMRDRLQGNPDLFAVQAEMRLFVTEAMGLHPQPRSYIEQADGSRRRLFPRPHPFCLMVRDSRQFRAVVEHVGLSTATRHAASPELGGSYDTFGLAAAAMRTHDLSWAIAGGPVLHYAQAAERRDPDDLMRMKDEDCRRRLEALRDTSTRRDWTK